MNNHIKYNTMLRTLKNIFIAFAVVLFAQSCDSRLDLQPEDNRLTADAAFEEPGAYKAFLAKLYAGISVSGQEGPAGNADLSGLDEGFSNYLRLYWSMQELTTDEAIVGWNDGTIKDLHSQTWTSGNEFIRTMYSRIFYQVALTNEFLRQTSDGKLNDRGTETSLRADIQKYRAEARFMRALTYWHAMDLFGNVPFVTEEDPIGAFLPQQIQRGDLFNYVEKELLAIESEIVGARQNEYGRADQAAVWMLLSKIYLNAEVYTGTSRYADVITYTSKIIDAGYAISSNPYFHLFLADNDTNGSQSEVIFPITFDGLRTQSFGGMTFLIHAAVGGSMIPAEYGINGGWAGLRTTSALVEQFPGEANSTDGRALFYTDGQTKEINNTSTFTQGYAVKKFRNVDINGVAGSDPTGDIPDTDFPMFRLSDTYLMYVEAFVRGGGGTAANAVAYINQLRTRAYGNATGNINQANLTLDFILSERSRELFWEAHRRTDLIRFGQFSDQGIWPWKGNVPQGATTSAFRNLMPLPATDLGINTNLKQNQGY